MKITHISQLDLRKQYTYADYLAWEITERLELIKGWIARMAAPNRVHQTISMRMTGQLLRFFERHPCNFFAAPFDVRLPRTGNGDKQIYTVVQPDLCVICDDKKLDKRGCIGAPDLVVEILSPGNSKKEMREKYDVYEESGIKEYWLVNPTEKTVVIYHLNDQQKYIGTRHYTDEDMMPSVIFPELVMDLAKIFEKI
jgi:Uma2 family endonuclease